MNASNAKDYLPLVHALAEGKELQFRIREDREWTSLDHFAMEYEPECYRIKPEPKEIWVNEYEEKDAYYVYDHEGTAKANCTPGAVTRRYREVIE